MLFYAPIGLYTLPGHFRSDGAPTTFHRVSARFVTLEGIA